MKQNQINQALQVALAANVPVLLWGPPGAGKTATVNALATAIGWPIETVLASLREPSDFAGLPIIVGDDMRLAPPDWARRLRDATDAICFFDELSTATPSTQRALLRVVHERVVGDLELGAGVRMVAAANPADVAAGGWDLTPPLANRFLHLFFEVDPAIVATGMLGRWPEAQPLSIDEHWRDRIARHAAVIAGFLSARPAHAHQLPEHHDAAGLAWPSPRSWDAVRLVLAAADGTGISPDARLSLVAGLVGDGVAIEFLSYERDLDLPDPEELLADPSAYRRPRRSDQIHAVVAAVTTAVTENLTSARWTAALRVLAAIAASGTVDIAAGGVRALAIVRPHEAEIPDELTVFGPILSAAGLLTPERSDIETPEGPTGASRRTKRPAAKRPPAKRSRPAAKASGGRSR
jgi:hypothetical protein